MSLKASIHIGKRSHAAPHDSALETSKRQKALSLGGSHTNNIYII